MIETRYISSAPGPLIQFFFSFQDLRRVFRTQTPHLGPGRPQWDSHGPGHRTRWPGLGSRNSAQPSLFCHFLHFYLFPRSKILQVDTVGSCTMSYQFRISMAAGGMEDLSNVIQGQMCAIMWPLQLFSSLLPALQVERRRKKSENI